MQAIKEKSQEVSVHELNFNMCKVSKQQANAEASATMNGKI